MVSFDDYYVINKTEVASNELRQTLFTIFLSLSLGILILITIVGNLFVIIAILLEQNLRTIGNYLVLSLAIADLMVACIVMPLGAVYEVYGDWNLGTELCDFWICADVLCCTASILHLLAIAIDRYWAVANIDYIHNRNANHIGFLIVAIWAISLIISIAPILGWKDANFDQRIKTEKICLISQDVGYQIIATFATFYGPLVLILLLYWRIYQIARKRIRQKPGNRIILSVNKGSTNVQTLPLPCQTEVISNDVSTNTTMTTYLSNPSSESQLLKKKSVTESEEIMFNCQSKDLKYSNHEFEICKKDLDNEGCDVKSKLLNDEESITKSSSSPVSSDVSERKKDKLKKSLKNNLSKSSNSLKKNRICKNYGSCNLNRESLESKRERKAAKTLAIITGVFVICWLPFFITALVRPLFMDVFQVPQIVSSLFLWLGYVNSMLNPVIYTIFSADFRIAFRKILFGRRVAQRKQFRA